MDVDDGPILNRQDAALNAYERVFARVSRGLDGPRTLDVDVLEGRADTGWSA